jgi:hypothetical protein
MQGFFETTFLDEVSATKKLTQQTLDKHMNTSMLWLNLKKLSQSGLKPKKI